MLHDLRTFDLLAPHPPSLDGDEQAVEASAACSTVAHCGHDAARFDSIDARMPSRQRQTKRASRPAQQPQMQLRLPHHIHTHIPRQQLQRLA